MYTGLRRDVSLLLSEGHLQARRYPVGLAWAEALIVRQRHGARAQRDALLLQMAIASNFSKPAGKQFQKIIASLDESD